MLNYQFPPVPMALKTKLRQELRGNSYKVMDAISDEIFLFPDTRLSLTKELSTRYLSKATAISQPQIVSTLNRLERQGYIKIVKSHVKGTGSLITLKLDTILISYQKKLDTVSISDSEKLDTVFVSKQEINTQELLYDKNNNTVVGLSPQKQTLDSSSREKSPREEKNKIQTQKPEDPSLSNSLFEAKKKEEVSFTPQNSINTENNFISRKEYKELLLLAEEINLKPSLITNGIKTLAKRNCENIRTVMEDIIRQVRNRRHIIKNKGGYFNSLCQRIDFDEIEQEDPETETIIIDEPTTENRENNGGFRTPPDWLLSDEPIERKEIPVEPTEEEILQKKRTDFGRKITKGFQCGVIQFVLSPDGTENKILTCTEENFSYIKNGHIKNAYWNELPEKLLSEVFFT